MNNIKNYQSVKVLTADGVRIVIMLCEGIIKFNKRAQYAIEHGDIKGRSENINRSLDIVSELSNSLNMEAGGEVAYNLHRLYDFATSQLTAANQGNNADALESVNRVMDELKAGWEHIAVENDKTRTQEIRKSGYISLGI